VSNTGRGGVQLLGTAGHHHRLLAAADCLIGRADALAAGCTGTGRGVDAPGQTEEHADVDRCGVAHHLQVGGGADAIGGELVEHAAEFADGLMAAGGGAIGHSGTPAAQHRMVVQPRFVQGDFGGTHRHDRHLAHRTGAFAVVGRRQLERLRRCGQSGVQPGIDIPLGHRAHGVAAAAQLRVDGRPVVAERTDGGGTGHHHAMVDAHQSMPPLTEITCRVM
jgi:hypothetical protein